MRYVLLLLLMGCVTDNPYPQLFNKNMIIIGNDQRYQRIDVKIELDSTPPYEYSEDHIPYGTVPKDIPDEEVTDSSTESSAWVPYTWKQ